MKRNKNKVILSSIVVLLPMVIVCLYGINYQKMLLHILVLMDNLMVIHQKNLQYLSYH